MQQLEVIFHNSNGVYGAVSLEFVILDNYCVVELKLTK